MLIKIASIRNCIKMSTSLAPDLDQAWLLGATRIKQLLQKIMFPAVVEYDNKQHTYRTKKVNSLFDLFKSISTCYERKDERQQCRPSSYSDWVDPASLSSNYFIKDLMLIVESGTGNADLEA